MTWMISSVLNYFNPLRPINTLKDEMRRGFSYLIEKFQSLNEEQTHVSRNMEIQRLMLSNHSIIPVYDQKIEEILSREDVENEDIVIVEDIPYFQPNANKVEGLINSLSRSFYKSFEVRRDQRVKHPVLQEDMPCDLVVFKMHDDQVNFEKQAREYNRDKTSSHWSIWEAISISGIKLYYRNRQQENLFIEVVNKSSLKIGQYGYESCAWYDEPAIARACRGFAPADNEYSCHVLALFYKSRSFYKHLPNWELLSSAECTDASMKGRIDSCIKPNSAQLKQYVNQIKKINRIFYYAIARISPKSESDDIFERYKVQMQNIAQRYKKLKRKEISYKTLRIFFREIHKAIADFYKLKQDRERQRNNGERNNAA